MSSILPIDTFTVVDDQGDKFTLDYYDDGEAVVAADTKLHMVEVILKAHEVVELYKWLGEHLSADTPHDRPQGSDIANNAAQGHSSHD